ncbi:hypothetical protein [Phytoactinopolyspora limicola]|uniref:hypothetical protein n=1 Tax=Phytoactinopolyspora limicola TaxID=2715536 RepID=UPI00140CBA9A|nr:hypothetical protein [Phytoactinopolyspora limicola]
MTTASAIALLSLLVSVLALATAVAVYARLRLLERTALAPGAVAMTDEQILAPAQLWPGDAGRVSRVLLLDGTCPICRALAEAGAQHPVDTVRTVALFATAEAADTISDLTELEALVDPDAWAALSEGYSPCLFIVGDDGRVLERRFVYADTDMPEMLAELTPSNLTR